ncbi:MAG: ABC transporter permease subunit [Pseudothermotoga sp.]
MRKIIVHVILIFLIIVILFPTVWVVTTSFRRDEAAFSSELFSSRLTLQNYIDLVAPQRNVPVLVQDMQNIISRAKPFNQLTSEEAQKKLEDSLRRLEQYLEQVASKHKMTKDAYLIIDDSLKKKGEKTRESVLRNLQQLRATVLDQIEGKFGSTDQHKTVLYEYLQKESFDSAIFRAFKQDLEKNVGFSIGSAQDYQRAIEILKDSYDLYIGNQLQRLNELSARMNQLNNLSSELKKQLSPVQDQVLKANLILENDMLPELNALVDTLEKLKNLKVAIKESSAKSTIPLDDSFFSESVHAALDQTSRIEQRLETLVDYTDLKKSVKDIMSVLEELADIDSSERSKMSYSDFIKGYKEIQPRLERILNEIESTMVSLEDKAFVLNDINEKLKAIADDIDSLEQEKSLIQDKVKVIESQLQEPRRIAQLRVFAFDLEARISTVNAISSFAKTDLLRYSTLLTWLRNFANSYARKDEVYAKLRKIIDDMRWIEEYRTFSTRFENASKNLDDVLKQTNDLLNDFEKTWRDLLSVSYSGVFVTSDHLSKLDDIVRSDFVNRVRSDLAVVMRKAGILMNLVPFSELRDHFKTIDREFYRIDQIWKQKTKHYFLRWVLNSVIISLVVALITTAVCATAAYPFSRMRFAGRKYGIMSFLLIQMFPGVIFMVAIYNLLNFLGRYIAFLGVDTSGGLILAYLTNIAYNMYLIKGFYDLIPSSLEEAAIVDGATRFQSFYKIVLPLARPILTVVFLLVFIGTFNEYVVARIILQNVQNYTYALGLQAFAVGPYETEWGLFTAAALLGMLPMVILFLSLQRYLVSGLTRGAVKE